MRTHIASAEIALAAAIEVTSDEGTRETYRGLLDLLTAAGDSAPSEGPALLDEVLTSLVFRDCPRESTGHVTAAMGDVATAHVHPSPQEGRHAQGHT